MTKYGTFGLREYSCIIFTCYLSTKKILSVCLDGSLTATPGVLHSKVFFLILDLYLLQKIYIYFRNDLNNIPFVRSPEGTAVELYDQYITGVTQVLEKHAPIISRKAKQQSDEWLSDSYRMARSLRRQFERRWRKHKSELNRSNCLV